MECEYCKHYDNEDGIKVCLIRMDAIDYIDTEDCKYFENDNK